MFRQIRQNVFGWTRVSQFLLSSVHLSDWKTQGRELEENNDEENKSTEDLLEQLEVSNRCFTYSKLKGQGWDHVIKNEFVKVWKGFCIY